MKSPKQLAQEGIPGKFNYYLFRVAQRWSIFSLVGMTIIYWIVLISEAVNIRFLSAANTKLEVTESMQLYQSMNKANDLLSSSVLYWSIICAALCLGMLAFVRVRKYEKRLMLDGVVAVVFCLLSVVFSQIAVKSFLSQI